MVIRLDENYNAMTSTALLGYVGETNARPVSVEGLTVDGADRYVLTIDYGDGTVYEVDITGGQWTPTADILRSAQTVSCQICAKKLSGDEYILVKKSRIFRLRIGAAIGNNAVPSPDVAMDALDKIDAIGRQAHADMQTAQSAAETATTAANNATKSATNAEKSANTAEQAASRAETAKTAAETFATQAETAKQGAETARAEAVKSQNNAKISAAQAATSAQQTTADKNITAGYAKTAKTNADSTAADRQAVQTLAEQVTADKATVAENAAQVAEDRTAAETAAQTAQSIADSLPEDYVTAVGKIAENTAEINNTNTEVSELKENLSEFTGCESIQFTYGFYINTSTSTVDVNTTVRFDSAKYAIVPCTTGDVFTISGLGGSDGRLWCFIDANSTVISVSGVNADETHKILIAPSNAVKLIINDLDNRHSFKGEYLVSRVDDIENRLVDVVGNYSYQLITGVYVNKNTGVQSSNASYSCTDFIPATEMVKILTYINADSACNIAFYDADKKFISAIQDTTKNGIITEYTLGENVSYFRVNVRNTNLSELVIDTVSLIDNFQKIKTATSSLFKSSRSMEDLNAVLINSELFTFSDRTINGITFTWDNKSCTVSGTATGLGLCNLYYNAAQLPSGMVAGKKYAFKVRTSDSKVKFDITFYKNGASYNLNRITEPTVIEIPTDAEGMHIRLLVSSGDTVSGNAVFDYIATAYSNQDIQSMVNASRRKPMLKPLILTFIDDDTTNDLYITKYHDSCMHNGIKGNYAVLTQRISSGNTSAEKLLEYADEGFGMLIHAYSQGGEVDWSDVTNNIDACRGDLARGLRDMRQYGFNNYNYWIVPGGVRSSDRNAQISLARYFGLNCEISTGSRAWNTENDSDRYYIKRLSFNPTDTVTETQGDITHLKAFLQECANTGGWAIVTTHFNEWGSLAWDETLDSNGYPVGYSRFNELVQYALSLGYECMSFQEAWSYFKPVLEYNEMCKI